MAVAPFQYYTSTGSVREDLIPDITNISPDDTPFTSRIGKVKATQRNHEFLTDALESRTAQTPAVEGAVFASATRAARTRLVNYTEILKKGWTVSGSVQAMDTVSNGMTEFRYQRDLRRKELANGIEFRCVGASGATGVSGASGTASQLQGLIPSITTNVNSAATSAQRTLTLAMANGALQSCWNQGGKPEIFLLGGSRKLNLNDIQSSSYGQRNIDSGGGGTLRQRIDVYEGEFKGTQEVVLSHDMELGYPRVIAILETARWKLAYLRKPFVDMQGKDGDAKSAEWIAEYTMEFRAEQANAIITEISG